MNGVTLPSMVIVGAGHCGGRAAQALREAGWAGTIHLIGMERHVPYERPPLSKELLTGEKSAEACQLRSAQALIDDGVRLHTQRVSSIDTTQRCITLANGQVWEQVEPASLAGVRKNDVPVKIKPGLLGVWYMKIDGYNTQAKVRRIK